MKNRTGYLTINTKQQNLKHIFKFRVFWHFFYEEGSSFVLFISLKDDFVQLNSNSQRYETLPWLIGESFLNQG